ncbi:MAG: hypothetical protein JO056_02045 [Alphaproteobacteria bacterium]|nr:hypothetical protein [Alphaproteobacteria bacterium]
MQLKIQRSQRNASISGKVIFCLDARAFLTAEEQANVSRYRLGGQVIYNSQASRKHLEKANEAGRQGSYFKSLASVALAALNLNITINGLQSGQHIECKDLDELLSAEEALMSACENLKNYLRLAATFDGREVVIGFDQEEPVALSQPLSLPSPIAPPPMMEPVTPTAMPSLAPFHPEAASSYTVTPDPLEGMKDWWQRLTDQQRMWFCICGGVLLLIILIRIL